MDEFIVKFVHGAQWVVEHPEWALLYIVTAVAFGFIAFVLWEFTMICPKKGIYDLQWQPYVPAWQKNLVALIWPMTIFWYFYVKPRRKQFVGESEPIDGLYMPTSTICLRNVDVVEYVSMIIFLLPIKLVWMIFGWVLVMVATFLMIAYSYIKYSVFGVEDYDVKGEKDD